MRVSLSPNGLAYIKEFGFFFFLRIAVAVSSAWELSVSAMGWSDRTVALYAYIFVFCARGVAVKAVSKLIAMKFDIISRLTSS